MVLVCLVWDQGTLQGMINRFDRNKDLTRDSLSPRDSLKQVALLLTCLCFNPSYRLGPIN